jgi:hypothetical protein
MDKQTTIRLGRNAVWVSVVVALSGCSGQYLSREQIRPSYRVSGDQQKWDEGAAYQAGKQQFSKGRYGLALEEFSADLARNPQSVRALNGIAACYDQMGRYDVAMGYYYRALALDSTSARTLSNLGYSLMLQHRDAAAARMFRAALKTDPGNAYARHNLAALERDEGGVAKVAVRTPGSAAPLAPQTLRMSVGVAGAQIAEISPRQTGPQLEHAAKTSTGHSIHPAGAVPVSMHEPAGRVPVARPDAAAVMTAAAPMALYSSRRPSKSATPPRTDGRDTARHKQVTMQAGAQAAATAAPSSVESPMRRIVENPTPPTNNVPAKVASARKVMPAGSYALELSNGNGRNGMARLLGRYIKSYGQRVVRLTNAGNYRHRTTTIYYSPGMRLAARQVAEELPVHADLTETQSNRADVDVRVVVGQDLLFYEAPIRRALQDTRSIAVADTRSSRHRADVLWVGPVSGRIEVSNGNGRNGMARLLGTVLSEHGERITRVTNADSFNYERTVIYYGPGKRQAAERMAARLPIHAQIKAAGPGRQGADLRIVVGKDFLSYEVAMRRIIDEHA